MQVNWNIHWISLIQPFQSCDKLLPREGKNFGGRRRREEEGEDEEEEKEEEEEEEKED